MEPPVELGATTGGRPPSSIVYLESVEAHEDVQDPVRMGGHFSPLLREERVKAKC